MNKDKKITLVMSFFIVILFITFLIGMVFSKYNKNFKLSLTNSQDLILLSFNNNKLASIYQIIVRDKNSNIVYNNKSTLNNVNLDFNAVYGDTYTVSVIAYNEKGKKISTSENKKITWNTATFDKTIDYMSNVDRDYVLKINGDISSNTKIYYYVEKSRIYEENVNNSTINFPKKLFNYLEQKIKAVLLVDDQVIDSVYIYIDKKIIDDVSIETPIDGNEYSYDDVNIKISGGKGATKYVASIYDEDELIYTKTFDGSTMTIPKNFFYEGELYKLIITATFNDYQATKQISDISFRLSMNTAVRPVYVNVNKYVKVGTSLTLNTKTANAKIIYTNDGTVPSLKNGLIYKEPIIITENVTIKTVAIDENNNLSNMNTYDFITSPKSIVLYISPSKQEYNKGVLSAGYVTEKIEMNKLADILIPKLKNEGYIVYRNNPNTDINTWASESKKVGADLHLALHSNGSVLHDESGVKTYIDAENNATYSLANLIEEALISVYYDKSNKNSLVSYANDRLGEVRPSLIPFGILLEIGYHDDYNDAFWIMNNMNNIADSIVGALNQYYGY